MNWKLKKGEADNQSPSESTHPVVFGIKASVPLPPSCLTFKLFLMVENTIIPSTF